MADSGWGEDFSLTTSFAYLWLDDLEQNIPPSLASILSL